MGQKRLRNDAGAVWALAKEQHGVLARTQLLALGVNSDAIQHRLANGRLHRVWRGVYALGRPELTQHGLWMAALLSCGPEATLSHESASALWGLGTQPRSRGCSGPIEITVPAHAARRRDGIAVHRRDLPAEDLGRCDGIRATTPARTLIDLATRLGEKELEAAVNNADRLDLIDPERLRSVVARRGGCDGVALLRKLLDHRTFALTDSELERHFLRLVERAGLPRPQTGRRVNGFKVDFNWPELRLIVETDGLRYHRTPGQQARDRLRDQVHTAAGMTTLRFTHAQVRYKPGRVVAILKKVAKRLAAAR